VARHPQRMMATLGWGRYRGPDQGDGPRDQVELEE
jgi:hypothetical protein